MSSKLNIPFVGIGTWKSDIKKTEDAIFMALKSGYKHIDAAMLYLNEVEVGKGIQKFLKSKENQESKNPLKREDLFITGKLWNTHRKKEHVRNACLKTIKDLQVKYLDLYLIHWPIAFDYTGMDFDPNNFNQRFPRIDPKDWKNSPIKLSFVSIQETWREMEKLVEEGLVKNIGISNFSFQSIIDLLSYAKIKPCVNQIECHPFNNQSRLIFAHKQLGLQTVAYCPLGSGKKDGPLFNKEIEKIAKKKNKTSAQIILKWNIQRGVVVLPRSVNENRIKENLNVFDFKLDDNEMEIINGLEKNNFMKVIDPYFTWKWPIFD